MVDDDNNMRTEKLIEQVRKYPVLYNTEHSDYKNVLMKAQTWAKVADESGLTVDVIKSKWKNLRDCYLKYKKTAVGMGGRAAKRYGRWPWSTHMEFLDTHILNPQLPSEERDNDSERLSRQDKASIWQTRLQPGLAKRKRQKSTEEEEDTNSDNKTRIKHDVQSEDRDNDSELSLQDYESESQIILSRLAKQTKRESAEERNRRIKRKSRDGKHKMKNEFDAIDYLFLSYAQTFKEFPRAIQAKLKIDLATLFAQTELRLLENTRS